MAEIHERQTMRVQVSPKTIEKASRLFNATLTDVINELLQNSRRAAASRIDIEITKAGDRAWLTFEDDGNGIFNNGISIVLGESNWDEKTLNSEDPAGMGIFALASRGAIIESAMQRVALTEAHFCGREEFTVERSDRAVGTKISFALSSEELQSIHKIVESCAYYYPLPVYFARNVVKQSKFLQAALYRYIWHGLSIGVVSSWESSRINFYGLVVNQKLPKIQLVEGSQFGVQVEIINAPELKLVLPTRKEVVKNEFFQALQQECYRTIYRYIASLESHQLSYEDWQQANALGVNLPEAKQRLKLYEPARADGNNYLPCKREVIKANALIVTADLSPPQAQTLWRGLNQADFDYVLYKPEEKYQGYYWYDNLPTLSEITFSLEKDSQVQSFDAGLELLNGERPDAIWVTGTLTYPERNIQQLQFKTDVAFNEDEVSFSYDLNEVATIFVSQDSKIGVAELADLIEAAFFNPSDDIEADSHHTQREDFMETAAAISAEVLLSTEEALTERIQLVVERHLRWLIPCDRAVEIAIDEKVCVKLKQRKTKTS